MVKKVPKVISEYMRELGKKGASKGGKASAAALTKKQRVARAKKAVAAREEKRKAAILANFERDWSQAELKRHIHSLGIKPLRGETIPQFMKFATPSVRPSADDFKWAADLIAEKAGKASAAAKKKAKGK